MYRRRKASLLVLLLSPVWALILNIGTIRAECNSEIAGWCYSIDKVLEGTDRDFLVGTFNATKGSRINVNLSSFSTNDGPFSTYLRICSANHGVIFGAGGPNFFETIILDFEDTYNITIYKSPTFSCVKFVGAIDVFREEPVAQLSSENWVEVERFSGGNWWGGTRSFRIDNFEWRIRWKYEPTIDYGSNTAVVFNIQVLDAKSQRVEFVRSDEKTNGVLYLYQSGEFYLYIIGFNTDNFTIIIEQNIDSVPEFPLWIILPLVLIITLFSVVVKRTINGV